MPKKRYNPRDIQLRPYGIRSNETVWYGGVELPESFDVLLEHREWPTSVVLSIRVHPDSGPIASGLRAGPGSTATYKDVQALVSSTGADEIVTMAAANVAGAYAATRFLERVRSSGGHVSEELRDALLQYRDVIADEAYPAVRPRSQRKLTPQLLREVAEVYRSAQAAGRPPTIAVEDHFTVSHRTATRWATAARKAGVLGPAIGTTAGELETGGDGDGES